MARVMATGTFDLFHKGHEKYLEQARGFGDELVVVVARDSNVKRLKGEPVDDEITRLANVQACRHVDTAILGEEGDRLKSVEKVNPDIICLGYDQKVDEGRLMEELKERNLRPRIVRAAPFKPEKYKSSKLRHL